MDFACSLLEVKSDRSLHDAWSSRGNDGSESGIRLLERCRADVGQRAVCFRSSRARIVDDQTVSHSSVNVTEVRMVENVVDFPPKLQCTSLAKFEILEKREIVVEDRRHAHRVTRHVADLSGSKWFCKTSDVESSWCSG